MELFFIEQRINKRLKHLGVPLQRQCDEFQGKFHDEFHEEFHEEFHGEFHSDFHYEIHDELW